MGVVRKTIIAAVLALAGCAPAVVNGVEMTPSEFRDCYAAGEPACVAKYNEAAAAADRIGEDDITCTTMNNVTTCNNGQDPVYKAMRKAADE